MVPVRGIAGFVSRVESSGLQGGDIVLSFFSVFWVHDMEEFYGLLFFLFLTGCVNYSTHLPVACMLQLLFVSFFLFIVDMDLDMGPVERWRARKTKRQSHCKKGSLM